MGGARDYFKKLFLLLPLISVILLLFSILAQASYADYSAQQDITANAPSVRTVGPYTEDTWIGDIWNGSCGYSVNMSNLKIGDTLLAWEEGSNNFTTVQVLDITRTPVVNQPLINIWSNSVDFSVHGSDYGIPNTNYTFYLMVGFTPDHPLYNPDTGKEIPASQWTVGMNVSNFYFTNSTASAMYPFRNRTLITTPVWKITTENYTGDMYYITTNKTATTHMFFRRITVDMWNQVRQASPTVYNAMWSRESACLAEPFMIDAGEGGGGTSVYRTSMPNNCGYNYWINDFTCSGTIHTSYCSSLTYAILVDCEDLYPVCRPVSKFAACDICGQCAGGADICNAVACGTTNNYGCSNMCTGGGTGPSYCITAGSLAAGSPCLCNGVCTSGSCVVGACAGNSQLSQSVSPPATSPMGTTVTFYCNYVDSATGSPIPGAIVNVTTNGVTIPATLVGSSYQATYVYAVNGTYLWHCSASDPSNAYAARTDADDSYIVTPAYCNMAWVADLPGFPGDFRTDHYAQVVGGKVHAAVRLTNSVGNPVSGVTVTINLPAGWGGPIPATSDINGLAKASFDIGTTTAGQYGGLSVDSLLCPGGVTAQPPILTTYVNAYHSTPTKIFVSDPNPPTITRNVGQAFSISVEVRDQYDNICNSSYEGTPYVTTNSSNKYYHTIAVKQQIYNSTDTIDYNAAQCSYQTGTNCYVFLNAADEAKHTFNLIAYAWPFAVSWTGIRNVPEEVTLDATVNPSIITPTGALATTTVLVMYALPPPPPTSEFKVELINNSIKVGDAFKINVTALLPNGSIDTSYNGGPVTLLRAERRDLPVGTAPQFPLGSVTLTNGVGSFPVNAADSLANFGIAGVYTIMASNGTVNGIGYLSVSTSGINHIRIVVNPLPVFRTLPFSVNATMEDIANNTIIGFSGQVNISCPLTTTDPPQQNVSLNSTSTAVFTQIANRTGTFSCNITAFDPVAGTIIVQPFTLVIIEALSCVSFSIPPNPVTVPPVDTVVNTSQSPPVSDVMEHNDKIGGILVGYDPVTKTMKGNYSICLESYYNGRACFNNTDIQFDKAPVSVCVKEFLYNPQADGRISDHINYNGVDDLKETFKHPEVVWGWGYKPYDGTSSACSGTTKYNLKFIPSSTIYQDYFNMTVTLPLTVLQPYNITNDTPLNPHELRAPEALLALDERNDGRLVKFNMDVPATWIEEYTQSIIGSGAQAITYDNRGNIYVALSKMPRILVLKLVRAYHPTLLFVKEIDVVTESGTSFLPYGLDTDSWGNLYVVGNTNPDSPQNQMCINIYNKSFDLNKSNNCCDHGNCSETWEGTVTDIAVQEDGGAFYIARDKKRTCVNLGATCFWEGYPYIEQYNASNPSDSKANISIFGQDGGISLWEKNPYTEQVLDPPCLDNAHDPTPIILPNVSDSGGWHYLRGLKYRRGYLFILDYMAPDHRADFELCSGVFSGLCNGCCVPVPFDGCLWPPNDHDCNGCYLFNIYENQITRIIAMDLSNYPQKSFIARAIIEPNMTVALRQDKTRVMSNLGLQTVNGVSYETHGIDVDNNFNVYIALKGKNNEIVRYTFVPGKPDPSLIIDGATSSSFDVVNGYNPVTKTWTVPAAVTNNVTRPDDVIGYPDLIKESMLAGVSCEGCSLEGAVQPSVCQGEIQQTNTTSYSSLQDMLSSGSIAAGAPAVHVTSALTPVYRRNFLTTNITAYLKFYYNFTVTTSLNDPACGGGGAVAGPAYNINNKQLNLTASSNNLTIPVEGGGDYFSLTRPNYPEKPPQPPNTLPYLAYDYMTNRFFYKHYPLIDNVSALMGGSADKEWMINASYRKTFQTMENMYYSYQYISTTPTLNENGIQDTVYNPRGSWNLVGAVWKWDGDKEAPQYLNPAMISYQFPQGTVPYNNTMNWSYPFAYLFTPATLEPNPLPFAPQSAPVAPAKPDYDYIAITNVSMLQLSITCNTSTNIRVVYVKTVTNTSYTDIGPCYTIDSISITGATDEAYLFIKPSGLPDYNGICFESVLGANASLCGTTKAWFRDNIHPNTVVARTSIEIEIPVPTRYPLIGEPYASSPSSLIIVPVHMSGPTLLTIHGVNNTPDYTNETMLSRIQGSVDLMGTQLPNPLPFRNVSDTDLYFHADDNLTLQIQTTAPFIGAITYKVSDGWLRIAGPSLPPSGDMEYIRVLTGCDDGCLLQFSNDSIGANIVGELFLWKYWSAYGTASTGMKDPSSTYSPPKKEAQVVPDDPMNRDFREIYSVSGRGYLGDLFAVYVDPDVILNIDNLTAANCTSCTTSTDCPNGVCNLATGACEFPNAPKCKEASHPSGIPCIESFVCPRVELSLLNESLEVMSDKSHDGSNKTRVSVVGTDVSSDFEIINGTTTLISYTNNTWKSIGGPFSDVFVIDVTDAIKGETIVLRTATTHTEVARLYLPSENYVTKSSIGTILPNPRRLRISSDDPTLNRQIHYLIKGTTGNTVPVKEDDVGTTSPTCTLTGPSLIQADPILADCDFSIDQIPSPQPAGIPFNIRIRALPQGWTSHFDAKFSYPSAAAEEHRNVCDATPPLGLTTPPGDGQATCLTTMPEGTVTPGYLTPKLGYPSWSSKEANMLDGDIANTVGSPDDISAGIKTWWSFVCGHHEGILIYKSNTPINVSALNIRIKTSDEGRTIAVRMSTDSACAPNIATPDPLSDWNNADMTSTVPEWIFSPTGSNNVNYLNNLLNYTLRDGSKWQNVYCIGLYTEHVCMGFGCPAICGAQQEFYIDTVGAYQDVWVPPVPPPPSPAPSFVAIKLTSPLNITGFNITAKNANAVNLSTPFRINMSDDPNCLTGLPDITARPANWGWSIPISLQATGSYQSNLLKPIGPYPGIWCLAFNQPDPGVKWYIDSVLVYYSVPAVQPLYQCGQFNGNATITDLDSMCPRTVGPFYNGVWSGSVIVPTTMTNDIIGVANGATTATSNQFNVSFVPGLSLVSFETHQAFTHVLSIKIWGKENEHFNITTAPLNLDEPFPLRENEPEQIGIIQVVPNDFVLGFHQNVSGTYLYSQKDSVVLNIPDNKSLGLHDFQFAFYDRFNNTFLNNYTIWLRQPTATTLDVQTYRDPSNINLTNVNITAQLLFQRYDRPDEKPNIPLPNQQIEIYVQNSSTTAYAPCDPGVPGVCPNPAIPMTYVEQSNCTCPDWWDVPPGGTGECMPNPLCHQYGKVGTYTTDAGGRINTSFKIYGFGRRLAFAVFWGTDVYAPSIDIKPFYAGGVSIGMGSFSMLEPVLVVTISLALLVLERKFNKQKKNNI